MPSRIGLFGGVPVPPAQPTPAISPSVPPPQVVVAPQPPQATIPISSVAQTAMRAGGDMAQQQEQLGLFGGAMSKMFNSPLIGTAVDRLIELSMRPEALTPRFGDTFISPLARAAAGQQMERRAGAAAAAESEEEFMRARVLAQDKRPGQQLTGETSQLLNEISSNREGLRLLDDMKSIVAKGEAGGGGNVASANFKEFFRLFNVDVGETGTEEYRSKVASYIANLQSSNAFGRELSKTDYETLNKILTDPGVFSSSSQLDKQLAPLVKKLNRRNQELRGRAYYFGLGDLASQKFAVDVERQDVFKR